MCCVIYDIIVLKKPPFSLVHTKRISRVFPEISTLGPVFQNLRSGHRKRRLREEEGEGYVHTIRDRFFKAPSKTIWYSMNSNDPWLHSLAAQTLCRRGIPVLTPEYLLPSQWVPVLAPTYLLPGTGRLGVHFAPKHGTEPILYVTLHFQDRRGTASFCHRNCDATTVHVCKQKPYPV